MDDAIRILVMDGVENAGSGHPGMAMGMADVMAVLASGFLKFNPLDTQWADRDRFVLSYWLAFALRHWFSAQLLYCYDPNVRLGLFLTLFFLTLWKRNNDA